MDKDMDIGAQNIITVVLADDHRYTRSIIRNYLNRSPDVRVIGEANDGIEALTFVTLLNPDVLLLDMEMVGLDGVDVLRQLQNDRKKVHIIALSAYNDREYIKAVLGLGADQYLVKDTSFMSILETIRQVVKGRRKLISSYHPRPANI